MPNSVKNTNTIQNKYSLLYTNTGKFENIWMSITDKMKEKHKHVTTKGGHIAKRASSSRQPLAWKGHDKIIWRRGGVHT